MSAGKIADFIAACVLPFIMAVVCTAVAIGCIVVFFVSPPWPAFIAAAIGFVLFLAMSVCWVTGGIDAIKTGWWK